MVLARIEGNVVSTVKHSSLRGWRLLICQPMDGKGQPQGVPIIAIDPHGAAMHETVMVSTDGAAARRIVNDLKSPVRYFVLGIVDPKEGIS